MLMFHNDPGAYSSEEEDDGSAATRDSSEEGHSANDTRGRQLTDALDDTAHGANTGGLYGRAVEQKDAASGMRAAGLIRTPRAC